MRVGGCREEVLEFAIGGDLVDKEDEQIDVEVWDYHWVNKPGNLTWYDEWYMAPLYMRSSLCSPFRRPRAHSAQFSASRWKLFLINPAKDVMGMSSRQAVCWHTCRLLLAFAVYQCSCS